MCFTFVKICDEKRQKSGGKNKRFISHLNIFIMFIIIQSSIIHVLYLKKKNNIFLDKLNIRKISFF